MNSTNKKIKSETDLKLRDPEKWNQEHVSMEFSGKYSNPKGLMVEVSL